MKTNMKKIIKWLNDRREQSKKDRAESLKASYRVSEKDGKVYLVCNGFAFMRISRDAQVSEITELLDAARKAATEYEGYDF